MKFKIQLLFLLLCHFSFAQKTQVINNESTSFKLELKKDTIDFIVVDNDLKKKKPIFLWCQGSQPVPLYINFKKDGLWLIGGGISNFDYEEIKKHYHLVVISMPQTPLIVDESKISKSYFYIGVSPDNNTPSVAFQKKDYLENYRNRAITVLQFLKKQKWVDNSTLIVAGHSQGSKVATEIAINYNMFLNLVYLAQIPLEELIKILENIGKMLKIKLLLGNKLIKKLNRNTNSIRQYMILKRLVQTLVLFHGSHFLRHS